MYRSCFSISCSGNIGLQVSGSWHQSLSLPLAQMTSQEPFFSSGHCRSLRPTPGVHVLSEHSFPGHTTSHHPLLAAHFLSGRHCSGHRAWKETVSRSASQQFLELQAVGYGNFFYFFMKILFLLNWLQENVNLVHTFKNRRVAKFYYACYKMKLTRRNMQQIFLPILGAGHFPRDSHGSAGSLKALYADNTRFFLRAGFFCDNDRS